MPRWAPGDWKRLIGLSTGRFTRLTRGPLAPRFILAGRAGVTKGFPVDAEGIRLLGFFKQYQDGRRLEPRARAGRAQFRRDLYLRIMAPMAAKYKGEFDKTTRTWKGERPRFIIRHRSRTLSGDFGFTIYTPNEGMKMVMNKRGVSRQVPSPGLKYYLVDRGTKMHTIMPMETKALMRGLFPGMLPWQVFRLKGKGGLLRRLTGDARLKFRSEFTPKTLPGQIASYPGHRGPPWVSPVRVRMKAKPRYFSVKIQIALQNDITWRREFAYILSRAVVDHGLLPGMQDPLMAGFLPRMVLPGAIAPEITPAGAPAGQPPLPGPAGGPATGRYTA